MRDYEHLLELLKEMNEKTDGRILYIYPIGADEDTLKRNHHAELLIDAGHAKQESDHVVRITNQGYDFLNAVESQPDAKSKFFHFFNRGIPYAEAATRVIDIVKGMS